MPGGKQGTGVLPGDAPLIIEPGPVHAARDAASRPATAPGSSASGTSGSAQGELDWNGEITPGPLEVGFDYSLHHPRDRRPRAVRLRRGPPRRRPRPERPDPGELRHADRRRADRQGEPGAAASMKPSHGHDKTIVNGISRIGYMTGGKAARWVDEDMADTLTGKAVVVHRAEQARGRSSSTSPRTTSTCRACRTRASRARPAQGPRGDAIEELDWCVGEVLDALDRLEADRNTLVIFTSDNGPVVDDGYQDEAVEKLGRSQARRPAPRAASTAPSRAARACRSSSAGRATVKPGVCDALVSQVDLLASLGVAGRPASCRRTPRPTASTCCRAVWEEQGRAAAHCGARERALADRRRLESDPAAQRAEAESDRQRNGQ